MFVTRNVSLKYMAPAGDEGSDTGGSDTGAAAAADAAKAAADAAALAAGAKKPSDEEARLLKENMKKKGELATAAGELAKLQAQLKAFEGIDPVAINKLLGEQKDAETKQLEAKGDFERLKTRMAEEHGKEIKTLKDQLDAVNAANAKSIVTINDLSVGTQFGQSKFISDELTLPPSKARQIYADHFELEDGKVVGYDKPRGAAARTALVDQYGASVGFDEALRKIVEADPEKDHLMKSKIKPGAGSDSKKATFVPKVESDMTGVSRIAAGLKGLKLPG